jgi:hypothetical protein
VIGNGWLQGNLDQLGQFTGPLRLRPQRERGWVEDDPVVAARGKDAEMLARFYG